MSNKLNNNFEEATDKEETKDNESANKEATEKEQHEDTDYHYHNYFDELMMVEDAEIEEEYFTQREEEGEQEEEEYIAVSIKSHRFNNKNDISYNVIWKSVGDDGKEILTSDYTGVPGIKLGSKYWLDRKDKLLEVTAYNEHEKVFTVKTGYMKQKKNIPLKMPIHYINKEIFTEFKRKENSALTQVSQQETTEFVTLESGESDESGEECSSPVDLEQDEEGNLKESPKKRNND